MAFDGTHAPRLLAYDKIYEIMKLIGSEDRWCQGTLTKLDGRRCLIAAMYSVNAKELLEPIILRAIHDVTGKRFRRIERFNDHRTTSHAIVMQVLGRARDSLSDTVVLSTTHQATARGFTGWLQRIWA
jgi:hypothetical protein